MANQNIIHKLNNGGVLSNLKKHSDGTMSARYICDYSNDGKAFVKKFVKIFQHSDNCTRVASREVQKNEILVYEHFKQFFGELSSLTLYEGYGKINGIFRLLFKYVPGLASPSENTLYSLLKVNDEPDDITPDMEKNDPLLRQKRVVTNNKIESLEEIVHITVEMCEQADLFHDARKTGDDGGILKDGVILVDISPRNVLIYTDNKGVKKVLLNDFGLARERNMKASELYSKASVSGISGSYYTTRSGITVNRVYHPPNFDKDYEKSIESSYDTYNLVNLLYLMLTGKLVESLEEWSTGNLDKLKEQVNHCIKERYPSATEDQSKTLMGIIVKGTSSKDERYSSAGDIAKELRDLKLDPPQMYQIRAPTLNPIALPRYLKECQLDSPTPTEMEAAYGSMLSTVVSAKAVSDEVVVASAKKYCSKTQAIDLFTPMVSEIKVQPKRKNEVLRKAFRIGLAATSIAAIAAAAGILGIYLSDGCGYKLLVDASPTININERRGDNRKLYGIDGVIESGDKDIGLSNVRLYEDNYWVYEWNKNLESKLDVNFSVDCPYGLTYILTAMDKRGRVSAEGIEIKPQMFAGKLVNCKEEPRTTEKVEVLEEIVMQVEDRTSQTAKLYASLEQRCGKGNCWSDGKTLFCEVDEVYYWFANFGRFPCEFGLNDVLCKSSVKEKINWDASGYHCYNLVQSKIDCVEPVSYLNESLFSCVANLWEYVCDGGAVCYQNNLNLKAEVRKNATSKITSAKLYNKAEVVKEWSNINEKFIVIYSVGTFKDDCYVLDVTDSEGNTARSNFVPELCQINYTYTTKT